MCKQIPLACGKTIVVDDADYERISEHGWGFSETGHITGTIGNRRILLHHFIMGRKPPKGYRVIHINYDLLDFRQENLVWVPHGVACQRQPLKEDAKSRYKGSLCTPKSRNGFHRSPTVQKEFTSAITIPRKKQPGLMTRPHATIVAHMHGSISQTE